MLTKMVVAFAIIATSATGSLAAAKKQYSPNPTWNAYHSLAAAKKQQHSPNPAWDVYDGRGVYIGSDPDSRIRADLLRDHGPYN
jgi:hypothetical protein